MTRILVVDDSALARRMLSTLLSGAGYEVLEAEDGDVALEQYFLNKPDLVMLDLVMRGLNGLELLTKLKELDPSARVVVATADIQDLTRQMVMEHGAKGYVTKPFKASEVLNAVAAALKEV